MAAAPRPKHPPLCETDHAASDPRDSIHLAPPSNPTFDLKGKARAFDTAQDAFSVSSSSSATAKASILGETSDKTSWNYVLRSGFAGGIAGCVAKSAIAPMDRVKILFQAQNPEFQKYSGKWLGVFQAGRDIVRSDGPSALFQGHSATLMRIFPYAAIKYMAYDKLHFYLMPTKQSETSGRLFLAGSASGVLSVFLTYPLELIRVRLAFETKRKRQKGGLRRIIDMIYREGATEAPFSSDARKRAARLAQAAQQANLSTSATSAITAAANAGNSIESALRATDPHVPSSAVPVGNKLLAKWPILKFYRGFSVTVMGMIPYAGTSFLVFGRCKTLLQEVFPTSEPSMATPGSRRQWYWPSKTVVDLSAGALAGALSQTAAYPFEVIRRRQQVGGIIRPGAMLGMWETAAWIYKTSGWRGFYVGLSIGFLKVVPMTSISFAVWLGMKRQMGI
ncbi:probable LEU5 - mitochondrial coenzyme A transporter- member of the mitochondrial carrier (MCF) family [Melanopsichium pennsylvanicum]|uniref:Probable LEU5 - mitochondrial coenzyme A transporter- member of the mitochondrial carrier (MCF) family n=2 Tax=Melanopsichium pennsylvanicum TaxID=63383 RepID=A0AAJ4XRA2_9BASI|nr:probable LEU5 - mitochondrial coenzyme A transporter- member of the mitochondrial carrier (MCF) family [Melanopsichium pennsylvanicum]